MPKLMQLYEGMDTLRRHLLHLPTLTAESIPKIQSFRL